MTTALDAALDRARITDPSERQRLHEVLADPEVSVPLSAAHRRYRRRMGIYLAALVASVVPAFMYGAGLLDAMPPEPSFGAGLLFAVFAFVPCTIAFIVVSAMSRDTELKSVIVRKLL